MEKESKTHYRKVFKSDHLGIADLEDFIEEKVTLIFTIKEVKQEYNVSVAGKKGNFNIAYFVEPFIKPLVLNATNSKTVKMLAGGSPFVENWKNIPVELYIDNTVKMKGEVVGGVRLRKAIIQAKEDLAPDHIRWAGACKSLKAGTTTIEAIKKNFSLTPDNEKLLLQSLLIPEQNASK